MFVGQLVYHQVYGPGYISRYDGDVLVQFVNEHQELFRIDNSKKIFGWVSPNELSTTETDMLRGFEYVTGADQSISLPVRKTEKSAGYDFYLPKDVNIAPGQLLLVFLDVKAYMPSNEWLGMNIRSSVARKNKVFLMNSVGIIDADYYNNPDNEGNIGVILYNADTVHHFFKKGTCIAQGIFMEYKTVSNENVVSSIRQGGLGSTGE